MRSSLAILASVLAFFAAVQPGVAQTHDNEAAKPTDNAALESLLEDIVTDFDGEVGNWNFQYMGVEMFLITDESADRMRVIAPILEAPDLDRAVLWEMLAANFDRALDAKYAIWRDVVWSTFAHPLASLTEAEFTNALDQVATLRLNYGTTWASTGMFFGERED